MSQLVAGVPISGIFADYLTLYEYFTIRVGVFFKFNFGKLFRIRVYTTLPI